MTDLAPAGWYQVPGGANRFWDGRMWTPDVLGAPSHAAEYAALSPDLPPPRTLVIEQGRPTSTRPEHHAPPPGWYSIASGALQWWDGTAWGPLAPPGRTPARPIKETGIAYLLFFLLGGVAAHRFYLGLTGSAIVFNLIWWGGWLTSEVAVGIPLIIIGAIWLFVDMFRIPSLVRWTNAARGYFR